MKIKVITYLLLLLSLASPIWTQSGLDSTNIKIVDTALDKRSDGEIFSPRFRDNFKTDYTDDAFDYNEAPEEKSDWNKFLERWFQNEKYSGLVLISPFWQWIFYGILFLLMVYAVYVIVSALLGKSGLWIFKKDSKIFGVEYDTSEQDVLFANFDQKINEAIGEGNYRLAIRYHYLQSLQCLTLNNVVAYQKEKTNSDYVHEIKNKNLAEKFKYISYIYDHIWYGAFNISNEDYKRAASTFTSLNNMI